MKSGLRRVMRRMFPDGRSSDATAFRRDFRTLEQRLGAFDDVLVQYAAGVVTFGLAFQKATTAVQRAEDARARGKGRRPSAAAIERLKRRQGLSWGSYDSAMKRLEELSRSAGPRPLSPSNVLNRQQPAGDTQP